MFDNEMTMPEIGVSSALVSFKCKFFMQSKLPYITYWPQQLEAAGLGIFGTLLCIRCGFRVIVMSGGLLCSASMQTLHADTG